MRIQDLKEMKIRNELDVTIPLEWEYYLENDGKLCDTDVLLRRRVFDLRLGNRKFEIREFLKNGCCQ